MSGELPGQPRPDGETPNSSSVRAQVEIHRRLAAKLRQEGAAPRAFAELERAAVHLPASPRLAADLAATAVRAGLVPSAVRLLQGALDAAPAPQRLHLRRRLAWLHRRAGALEDAREQLIYLLAERPEDRRGRAVLNGLLLREQRWEELDASLEKEASLALRRRALRTAARANLQRGRLWGERLGNNGRAALRYGQAAEQYEEAQDAQGAFAARLLALRSAQESGTVGRALKEQVRAFVAAAKRSGREERAQKLLTELGLTDDAEDSQGGVRTTLMEMIAVAEEVERAGSKQEAAALLSAVAHESPGPDADGRLEAHYVARGAWRELAQLYRDRAGRAVSTSEKVDNLGKLAELLEDELSDLRAAADAYGEIVKLTGDRQALAEQVRLLKAREDGTGIRRALDEAVDTAHDSHTRAQALLTRAEALAAAKQPERARVDFEAALAAAPDLIPALAGLAEVSAALGELGPYRRFKEAQAAAPRRAVGRQELFRRLARLADGASDADAARWAWGEVLADAPGDDEARGRLEQLARALGDDIQLEQVLKAQLKAEPRGPKTRRARLDLVELLEEAGRKDEALAELRAAVRFEPGHQEAWVALTERLVVRGINAEAAWAMEHAATATENDAERARLWLRLAQFLRDVLHDSTRAAQCEQRAANISAATEDARGKAANPNFAPTELVSVSDELASVLNPLAALPVPVPGKNAPAAVERTPSWPSPPPAYKLPLATTPAAASRAGPRPDATRDRVPTETEQPAVRVGPAVPPRAGTGQRAPVPPPPPPDATVPLMMDEVAAAAAAAAPPRAAPPPPQSSPPSVIVDSQIDVPVVHRPNLPEKAGALPRPPRGLAEARKAAEAREDAEALQGHDDVLELHTGDYEPVDPPRSPPPPPAGARTPVEAPTEAIEVTPSRLGLSLNKRSEQRDALVKNIQDAPLEPKPYYELAAYFDESGDEPRAGLMEELGAALEGGQQPSPRAPRLMLSATDRAGLRHPALRSEAGELLSMTGAVLVRLYKVRGRAAGSPDTFRLDSGRGSAATANALLAAVRVLGLRAPDVFLSEENGPPFALVFSEAPRLLIGQLAVKRELVGAELRFFAGRALFTQNPDLLLLRSLRREQLARALEVLGEALGGGRKMSPESKVIRELLPPKAVLRIKELYAKVGRTANLTFLAEAARHSANRAGLVVAGGVAPALAALRAKRALDSELVEVMRFAASERYLELRQRQLR